MGTRALILAAGRGSRLGPKTEDVPKPLLQVGSKTLVDHQIEMLADAGVGPVAMVVGYRADEIIEAVGLRAEFINNSKWAQSNSLYSFLTARDWAQDDLIVMNCDLLVHPEILNRLLAAGPDAFAYDSSSGDGREHMKVSLDGGHLVAMSKELPADEISGENVGILYFKKDTVALLMEEAQRCIDEGRMQDWLGTAVERIASACALRAVDVEGLPWTEIDFAVDLDRARKEVLPQLTRRPTRRFRLRTVVAASVVTMLLAGTIFQASSRERGEPKKQWNTVAPFAKDAVQLQTRGGTQQWWLAESGDVLTVAAAGSRTLRVESRLIPRDPDVAPEPYLLEISVDGQPLDWRRNRSNLSGSASYEGDAVCKRERDTIDLPDGARELQIRVRTTDGQPVLLRVRGEELDLDDDS